MDAADTAADIASTITSDGSVIHLQHGQVVDVVQGWFACHAHPTPRTGGYDIWLEATR